MNATPPPAASAPALSEEERTYFNKRGGTRLSSPRPDRSFAHAKIDLRAYASTEDEAARVIIRALRAADTITAHPETEYVTLPKHELEALVQKWRNSGETWCADDIEELINRVTDA